MGPNDDLLKYSVEVESPNWRLSSRNYEAMSPAPRARQGEGRFDDPTIGTRPDTDGYSVLYCAETPEPVFLEVLEKYRPALDELKTLMVPMMIDVSEREEYLASMGKVPGDWPSLNRLASAEVVLNRPIFDLTHPAAVQMLREKPVLTILTLGHSELDFSDILSSDRLLTRAISRWIWKLKDGNDKSLFSGIRYRSRFDPECICLALYQDRYEVDGEIDIQLITSKSPGFAEAASILRLEIS